MALRPCNPGEEYRGPVRVPVSRSSGKDTYPGVSYRPTRQFWNLRPADYVSQLEHYKQMAEERRAGRKAEQEKIKMFGPDISEEDIDGGDIGADCKVLKNLEYDGKVRLYYRRQELILYVFHY